MTILRVKHAWIAGKAAAHLEGDRRRNAVAGTPQIPESEEKCKEMYFSCPRPPPPTSMHSPIAPAPLEMVGKLGVAGVVPRRILFEHGRFVRLLTVESTEHFRSIL